MQADNLLLTEAQKQNFKDRTIAYHSRINGDSEKKYTAEEIVLQFLADRPNEWFYTWELMGQTKFGWLSHATHATLRKAEQRGLIIKDYIGKYVVYTYKPQA